MLERIVTFILAAAVAVAGAALLANAETPVVAPAPAPAATPAVPLTIGKAVAVALQRNTSILLSREKVTELDAVKSQTYSALFPNLSLTGTALERKDPITSPLALFGGNSYNNYTLSLQIAQPIWASGALTGAIGVAKSNRAAADIDQEIAHRELTLNVIQAFYGVILHQRNLATLEREKKVDEELIKAIQDKYKTGRAQLLDVLQTKTQVALLTPRIAQARNQVQISATQLSIFLGNREASEIAVSGSLDSPDRKQLESELKVRPLRLLENEKAEEALRLIDSTRQVTLAKDLPYLGGVATYGRSSYVKTDLFNDEATQWTIGLQLNVPLFSGLSSIHQRHAFASQEAQLAINRAGIVDATQLAQIQAVRNLDISQETIETTILAHGLAEQSLTEARRNYRLGTITLIQYQTSQSQLLDAEVSLDQSRFDYIVNLSKYATSMGLPASELVARLEGTQP